MIPAIALVVWILAGVFPLVAFTLALAHPLLVRRHRSDQKDPRPISILLPVQGLHHDFQRCLETVYGQDYADFEIVVCSSSEDAPAYRVARQIARRHPERETQLVIAKESRALNPKVNNLIPAFTSARHDTLLICDSNIELSPGSLTAMIRHCVPGVGLVCAIPVGEEPQSLAAELEQTIMNARDALYTLGGSTVGLNLGYGKVMLFSTQDFERAGGVDVIAHVFGDDHALARAFARNGLRTIFADNTVRQPLGDRSLSAVIDRQLRWMVIRRNQEPYAFVGELLTGFPVAVLAGALAAPLLGVSGWLMAIGTLAFRIVTEMAFLRARGWGMTWRYPALAIIRDLMTWVLWFPALRARKVNWGGRTYGLATNPEAPSAQGIASHIPQGKQQSSPEED